MNLKTLYIDGTKIESAANRYTFVWRKSVEKNQKKLMEKMSTELELPEGSTLEDVESLVKLKFSEIRNIFSRNRIEFVYRIGRRKTPEQRTYEYFKEAVERFDAYRNHLAIMGTRNSKPANYEWKKKRKTKNDIGRKENMLYLEEQDVYVCKADKQLVRGKDQKRKTSSGMEDTLRVYTCKECADCEHAQECIKPRKNMNPSQKNIMFSRAFEQYRLESESNILSSTGIDYRINRSIQTEGAFSKVKDGMKYNRFRHRSMEKVVSDLVLVALGLNINKLHSKLLNNQTEIISCKKTA